MPSKPINRGFLVAGILTVVGTFLVAMFYVGNDFANAGWKVFGAVVVGLVLASRQPPHRVLHGHRVRTGPRDRRVPRTGPATVVLSGTSSGLESSVYAIVAIAAALGVTLDATTATCSSRSTSWRCVAWACWPRRA